VHFHFFRASDVDAVCVCVMLALKGHENPAKYLKISRKSSSTNKRHQGLGPRTVTTIQTGTWFIIIISQSQKFPNFILTKGLTPFAEGNACQQHVAAKRSFSILNSLNKIPWPNISFLN
jgi:hypothetical protein